MAEYMRNVNEDIKISININQRTQNGLYSLINWLDGFRMAKGGEIPGEFELVMLFRTMQEAIQKSYKENDINVR